MTTTTTKIITTATTVIVPLPIPPAGDFVVAGGEVVVGSVEGWVVGNPHSPGSGGPFELSAHENAT